MKRWLLAALVSFPALALEVGTQMPPLTLVDQFDAEHSVPVNAGTIVFTDSRAAGAMVTEAMTAVSAQQRSKLNYLVDVSGMPSLVTKMFAIPKWQDLPFAVLIDQQGEITAALPRQPDQVSMLCVADGKLTEVRYYADVATLQQALSQPWCN
ncbi:hypothetical protein [Ferrimonas senticii]|uniref:hypothetical protein n=1 Tax=Ferrimonas senticii TaxID=394566 RepID=UPI0004223380|nr:hypothetical protein [Ferrimonas senticii]